jgi:PAS domain S-box-containing protein
MISTLLSWNLSRDIENRNALLTKTINRQIEEFFSTPNLIMSQLKGLLELIDDIEDHAIIDGELKASLGNVDFFDQVLILDKEGVVIHLYPFNDDIIGNDFSRQPLFQDTTEKDIHWSPVFISSITGKPTVSISLSFSQGIIVGQIDLVYLFKLISEIEIEKKGFAIITDQRGTVIVHPDNSLSEQRVNISNRKEVEDGRKGIYGRIITRWDERKYICSSSPISRFNWMLFIYQDYLEVYSLNRSIGLTMTLTILVALIVSLILTRIISSRILNPLLLLDHATRDITRGYYDTFEWETSYSELDRLAENFRKMMLAIGSREREIDGLKSHLANIIDSMPSLMIGVDNEFHVSLWNGAMVKLTHMTNDQAIGQNVFDAFPSLFSQKDNIEKCINHGLSIELNKVRNIFDKKEKYYDITIYPLIYNENRGAGIRIDDVTSMVNTEIMMQQSEKLNSLGKLSAGISHDLNNMLTPILGYGELLKDHLDKDETGQLYSEQILESAERARNLVRQLLVFSKKQNLEYKTLDINYVLLEFQKLLVHSIPENIKISFQLQEGLRGVNADRGQLEQVIMNLAINARDAMTNGGELNISTGQIYLNDPIEPVWEWNGAGYFVFLTISDTGQGMEPDVMNRIFEPFFSTKGNRGSGLGLSMVYGIIEQHKGYITVNSQDGRGTKFSIYLPASDNSKEDKIEKTSSSKSQGRGGKLLLVEDDESVRTMTESYLVKLGYQVLSGTNGEEGLNLFSENRSAIKMIITDVIMPKMNGKEMVIKAREFRPDIPVLYISGYSDNLINYKDSLEPHSAFLEKPFKLDKLHEIIRQLIF